MELAYGEPGRGGAHGSTELGTNMGVDFENKLFEVAEAVARIEASMAKKEDLATLAQKLQGHIEVEDEWRTVIDQQITTRRGWWQIVLASLASSGLLTIAWEMLKSSKH